MEESSIKALASTDNEATLRKLEDASLPVYKGLSDAARVKRELQQIRQSDDVLSDISMRKSLNCIIGNHHLSQGISLVLATYSNNAASSRSIFHGSLYSNYKD